MPLISVIIPTYNHARYLRDAVNSLFGGETCLGVTRGQTMRDFEIVVVDDGSTDNAGDIVAELQAKHGSDRLLYVWRSNGGTAAAHNTGIEIASGKYITCLSADDMMEANRLEYLLAVASTKQNRHSVICDNLILFRNGARSTVYKMIAYDFDDLLLHNSMHVGIFYPTEAWEDAGGYPEIMRKGREDWAFNVALGRMGWCGVHVDYAGYLYRREGQNRTLTNTDEKSQAAFLEQMHSLFPELYRGERTMVTRACCGRGRRGKAGAGGDAVAAKGESLRSTLAGMSGMELLRYVGENSGNQYWTGPVTHARYKFSASKREKYVDVRDIPGMLEMHDSGLPAFERVNDSKEVEQFAGLARAVVNG